MVKSWGGFRKNAGRKHISNKKIPKQVYFPPELIDAINSTNIPHCNSFSAKAVALITKEMQKNEYRDME